jgi:hypothetical protein
MALWAGFVAYLWPWAVVVFLVMLVVLLVADNLRVRLRSRSGRETTTSTEAPPLYISTTPLVDPADVLEREREIKEVLSFVDSDDLHFLCLVGPGGVGKTSVVEAALSRMQLSRMQNVGYLFAEVSAIDEKKPDQMAVDQAFAVAVARNALRVELAADEDPVTAVANVLRRSIGTRTALVIDNVEQVANTAASIIHQWVRQNPLVRIIVTSQVDLKVAVKYGRVHPSSAQGRARLPAWLNYSKSIAPIPVLPGTRRSVA